jgi:hypothetical protein
MVAKSSYSGLERREKDQGYVTKRFLRVNTMYQMIRGVEVVQNHLYSSALMTSLQIEVSMRYTGQTIIRYVP